MQIPLILTPAVSIIYNNRIPQKQSVNKIKEEEQEDEYINAFDFVNNFQC